MFGPAGFANSSAQWAKNFSNPEGVVMIQWRLGVSQYFDNNAPRLSEEKQRRQPPPLSSFRLRNN
jgi:hypothetical protein